MSREKILQQVLQNQPLTTPLPDDLVFNEVQQEESVAKFVEVVTLIGATVVAISEVSEIESYIKDNFANSKKIITPISSLSYYATLRGDEDPHQFEDVDFAVFQTQFAVAENGATWITEYAMGVRVLPFITQHLGLVVNKETIVANMQEAYQKIDNADYGFGTFIAGPSKTADIEQSLVLGAHGARSLIVFLLG